MTINTATSRLTPKTSHEKRCAFNAGYWDAMNDRSWKQSRKFPMPAWNKPYCAGYEFGKFYDSTLQTSDAAWSEYTATN